MDGLQLILSKTNRIGDMNTMFCVVDPPSIYFRPFANIVRNTQGSVHTCDWMARDHCMLKSLSGRDYPSSLHTKRWRPRGSKKLSWMINLHKVPTWQTINNVLWSSCTGRGGHSIVKLNTTCKTSLLPLYYMA